MQPKDAPWNAKNSNVLIVAGSYMEEFALKYGICIMQNRINLIPCRYIAFYNQNVLKYLFEIIKNPLDDCTVENTVEIKQILQNEKLAGRNWIEGKELCRLMTLKKVIDVGPIINDYISRETGMLTPLTIKIPRYTTMERIKTAELTSELKCGIDIEEFEDEIVEPEPEPIVIPKKSYKKEIIFAIVTLIILALIGLAYYFSQKENVKIVEKKVYLEKEPVVEEFILKGNTFDSGSSDIKPSSTVLLENILSILGTSTEKRIIISGHTDNIGNEQDNIVLSLKRAESIKSWFTTNGINPNKIECFGKGSAEPKYDNSTEDGRAMNRRTEIKVISN